jgi:hypothetical protein
MTNVQRAESVCLQSSTTDEQPYRIFHLQANGPQVAKPIALLFSPYDSQVC